MKCTIDIRLLSVWIISAYSLVNLISLQKMSFHELLWEWIFIEFPVDIHFLVYSDDRKVVVK